MKVWVKVGLERANKNPGYAYSNYYKPYALGKPLILLDRSYLI